MPTNHTANYQLSQWEPEDKVLRTDFNADNAKIDAAIKAEADARASGMAALSKTVSGHADALDKKGNCRIVLQTYTGTGTFGYEHPTMRYFPGKPLMVRFMSPTDGHSVTALYGSRGSYYAAGSHAYSVSVIWSGNSVGLWHSTGASQQMNLEGATYQVLALIAADE